MPVKRNLFIQLTGGTSSVNRELEAKAGALAGIKGYLTNLRACPDATPVTAEFATSSYHRLFEIDKSFRMSTHDLKARQAGLSARSSAPPAATAHRDPGR